MRFILVDEILDMVPGKKVSGIKRIDPEEDYFRDHFPGFPVVPGVLLTEMMAQTAGKCLDVERRGVEKSMLAEIRSARFRDWVRPGDAALIHAEITTNRERFATAKAHVTVNERIVCSAELFFAFLPLHKLVQGYVDEVLEAHLSKRESPENGAKHGL